MGLLKRLALAVLNQPAEATTALAVRSAAPPALSPYEPQQPNERRGRELQRYAPETFPPQYAPRDFYEMMQPPPPVQAPPRRKKIIVTETITRREG